MKTDEYISRITYGVRIINYSNYLDIPTEPEMSLGSALFILLSVFFLMVFLPPVLKGSLFALLIICGIF